jgi:hypothetical protein
MPHAREISAIVVSIALVPQGSSEQITELLIWILKWA